jgi:DNA-binding transcriptional MerR regulator
LDKSPEAFRTISEVAVDLDVPKHVLRFWEGKFTQLRPLKRGGGRRYYRPEDVNLLRGIRQLLYGDGYTIKGVQRILREQGIRHVMSCWELTVDGSAKVDVTEIPDVAADVAMGVAGQSEMDGNPTVLASTQIKEFRSLLAELGECRKLLAEAKS